MELKRGKSVRNVFDILFKRRKWVMSACNVRSNQSDSNTKICDKKYSPLRTSCWQHAAVDDMSDASTLGTRMKPTSCLTQLAMVRVLKSRLVSLGKLNMGFMMYGARALFTKTVELIS